MLVKFLHSHTARVRAASLRTLATHARSSIGLAFDHFPSTSDRHQTDSRENEHDPIDRPTIILHGLFGSRQNWRTLAKRIAQKSERDVFVLDLRNHGESGATPGSTNYLDYAGDVEAFINHHRLKNVNLIGHSMGGKVAMSLALHTRPTPGQSSIISKLVVVDISPLKGRISEEFTSFLKGMKEINEKEVQTRKEADQILTKYTNDLEVRQFLLTNLKKSTEKRTSQKEGEKEEEDSSYKIRLPLDTLSEQIHSNQIGDFPFDSDQPNHPKFSNPTLFLKGEKSKYINKYSLDSMNKFFPNHKLVVFDTGHWVHAEKPNEFINTVTEFFDC